MRNALAVCVLFSAAAVHGGESLAIAVCNDEKAPSATVEEAEKEASFLFQAMAVRIHWLGCGHAHGEAASDFVVRLLPGAEASRAGLAPLDAMGRTYLDDHGRGFMADVYYTRVQALWLVYPIGSIGPLLGCAMAHELGHLLLGAGHRPTGLMRAAWGREQLREISQGCLRFNLWERGVIIRKLQIRDAGLIAVAL